MALSKIAPSSLSALLAAAALAACGPAGDPSLSAASDAVSVSAIDPGNAGGNKQLTVMTRNLYLGAELSPVILSTTPEAFVATTTALWETVKANNRGNLGEPDDDVLVRLEGIADEIGATRPDLVGLQEVYTWEVAAPGTTDFHVVYDYLGTLLAQLAERGLHYEVVNVLPLFQFAAPIATGETVRTTDHLVILARDTPGLHVSNPQADVFGPPSCATDPTCFLLAKLPVPALGEGASIAVPRGWTSADVRYRGETLRFVNTHLESFSAGVRTLQAQELAGALATAPERVVLAGDLNSTPGTEAQAVLLAAGFRDVWTAVSTDPGNTSPFPELLSEPEIELTQRIDYVLARGPILPLAAEVVGIRAEDRVDGLWPTDHAGVVATLRLLDPRFLALIP